MQNGIIEKGHSLYTSQAANLHGLVTTTTKIINTSYKLRTKGLDHSRPRAFLRRGRQPEENISRARTQLSLRFLYYSSLM